MINIRALTQKPATSQAVPPKKNSIPARIFIYKGGFSPANPNNVEHYVYDTQDKLLGEGYAIADKSATGNAMMFTVPIWAGLMGQEMGEGVRTAFYWLTAIIAGPCALLSPLYIITGPRG